ncbi:unnamed protein product [Pipistrellus nathusii]|uniref:Uncharacterized protein n=1 Tax=Pipistrellus nathusii TaxID=59473 RepID=A0ABP0AJL5_PIPNA
MCKGCAAKIPSGQTGPSTDCLLSFFPTSRRDVLGRGREVTPSELGGKSLPQLDSPSPTLTQPVSSYCGLAPQTEWNRNICRYICEQMCMACRSGCIDRWEDG